ncbi:MAG: HAD family hydrolase [Niabella sp.]
MVKLIVTDLDGSLLNDAKEIPEDFWEVEKVLHQNGVTLAIASGRPLHNIATAFNAIKERTYFISDNGSYVVYQDEELLALPIDKAIVQEFVTVSRGIEYAYPVLCGKQMAFMEKESDEALEVALQYYQDYELVNDLSEVDEPVLKISICDFGDPYTNSYPHYKKYEKDYKVAVAGTRWLDITGFEADKGNAVKLLQNKLGIAYDETMVFGDYLNDLQLMGSGKYSFAMKNAQPEIIKAANYITSQDNNHQGVIDTIKEFLSDFF